MPVGAAAMVNQIVTPDCVQLWIREKGERVTHLVTQLCRFLRRIDTDGYRTDACILKLLQIFLNTS